MSVPTSCHPHPLLSPKLFLILSLTMTTTPHRWCKLHQVPAMIYTPVAWLSLSRCLRCPMELCFSVITPHPCSPFSHTKLASFPTYVWLEWTNKMFSSHPLVVYVRRTTSLRPLRIVVTANYSFNPHSSPVVRVPGDLNYKINRPSKHRVRRATFPAAAAFSPNI